MMIGPVAAVEQWLARVMGTGSEAVVLGGLFVLGLGVAPLVIVGGAAMATRRTPGVLTPGVLPIAIRYVHGLVPFGFGVWLAHYGFHLLTGALVVVPVTQSAVMDLAGWPALGEPLWHWAGMRPGAVFPIQLGFILLGATGSLGVLHLIADADHGNRAGRAMLPWALAVVALAALAIWILFQPMEMRGTG